MPAVAFVVGGLVLCICWLAFWDPAIVFRSYLKSPVTISSAVISQTAPLGSHQTHTRVLNAEFLAHNPQYLATLASKAVPSKESRRHNQVPALGAGVLSAALSFLGVGAILKHRNAQSDEEQDLWAAAAVAEEVETTYDTVRVFIDTELYKGHRVARGYHAENQGRVEAVANALEESAAALGNRLERVAPPTDDASLKAARDAAVLAHSEFYVNAIEDASRQLANTNNSAFLEGETYVTEATYSALLAAMSSWLAAAQHALTTGQPAMSISRPPGHHAMRELPMGFCIFNFGAATALYLRQNKLAKRVAILDWDVHQGNGLVDILVNEPRIRYVSLHQVPCYPYRGETLGDVGPHLNCRNVPVPAGTTWAAYRDLFVTHALPFLNDPAWGRPDLVIVCAGYDACAADQLAGVCLQPEDFHEMAQLLRAHLGPKVPIALGLEGGYDFDATSAAVVHTIEGLSIRPDAE